MQRGPAGCRRTRRRGQPMHMKITSYEKSEESIRFLRDTVFGQEQKVPRVLDWDGLDSRCIHIVATDSRGNPVGTGRMDPGGKIGRLAVLGHCRGRGIGAGMIRELVESARRIGLEKVQLHAQRHAVSFYERLGFEKNGEEFLEAGIPHVRMTLSISDPD